MIKIAITGPESSGKSTLAAALAQAYATVWVPEYARHYLEGLRRPYRAKDLLVIARGQLASEHQQARRAQRMLFCDTDLLVVKIWSQEKFGRVDPRIEAAWQRSCYDLHLLCQPDLPWSPDPLREHPDPADRWRLYAYYRQALLEAGRPFVEISGIDDTQRVDLARQALTTLCQEAAMPS